MSALSPSDAAVAVRSFPRRFRALLARPEHDEGDPDAEETDPGELARRPGPDGSSAADHLVAAHGVLTTTEQALAGAVGHEGATLDPTAADPSGVSFGEPDRPLEELLDRLDAAAATCADVIERVPNDEWGRQLPIRGQDTAVALVDVVRTAVDVVAAHLRAAERTIQAVK